MLPNSAPLRAALRLLLWLLCALLLPAHAVAEELVIPAGAKSLRIDRGVSLLIERPEERLTPELVMSPAMAARWQPYTRSRITLPGQRTPVWIRFDLRAEQAHEDRYVLATEWALLSEIDFHQYDRTNGRWVAQAFAGLERMADDKLLKEPAPSFALAMADAPSSTVLLRVRETSQFFVPLTVWEKDLREARRYDHALLLGLLFGILGVMFFYNLSLYAFTREKSFRIYCLYLAAIIGYELAVTGIGPLYVWTDVAWINRQGYVLFATLSFFSAAVFFRRFLDLGHAAPHLNRINLVLIGYWVVVLVLALTPIRVLPSLGLGIGSMLSGIAGVYTALYLVMQGNVLARYILVAWSTIIAATFATTFALMGLIDGEGWVLYAQHVGFVVETVLLSVALAARIKRDRLSKEAAETESRELARRVELEREEKLRAQEHALDVQRKANEELELRVLDRTAELKRTMENLELANRELAKLSVTDALTKVHNRRYFDEVLRKEYDRSARGSGPLALLLVDIDFFKKINDTVGHLGGDECLKLVAAALSGSVGRSTDLVARYGGEEFALVLPGTDAPQAMEIAERIRKAVEDIQFIYRGRRVPVSVSLGVIARVADPSRPLSEFIREADQALYAAKAAGRNRAVQALAA